ncbi:hypothetical protein KDW82_08205 [Burkholderia vietnamiensis]|uniref:hypothetical protein n=1 Tax=Burkholderia vietnamiensis TaxID=60552 RepID=UPI001B995FEE|nr:hypothetical protein [Burkholderia vietnamiensis]MBR8189039.1 hypothetical protein [Burkholderia vietnamiensis]
MRKLYAILVFWMASAAYGQIPETQVCHNLTTFLHDQFVQAQNVSEPSLRCLMAGEKDCAVTEPHEKVDRAKTALSAIKARMDELSAALENPATRETYGHCAVKETYGSLALNLCIDSDPMACRPTTMPSGNPAGVDPIPTPGDPPQRFRYTGHFSCESTWDHKCVRYYHIPLPAGLVMCSFDIKQTSSKTGGYWARVDRPRDRLFEIAIWSQGSNMWWDRWGGNEVINAEWWLISEDATAEQRRARGCTCGESPLGCFKSN